MTTVIDDSPDTRTLRRLRRVMAVFTGLLIVSTWPLWWPGTAFPDIPWFGWAVFVPPERLDVVWLAALVGFLGLQFVSWPRASCWRDRLQVVLFAWALLLLPTDQHRLQPWVWQMLIGTLLIGLSKTDTQAIRSLRAFTISIYAWSAVSKCEVAFLDGHGQLLLDGLTKSLGLSTELWAPSTLRGMAALFPAGELLVATMLAVPRTRQIGLHGALAMHALLILTLGPTGLGHEWGVLLWNVFFIVQARLLFTDRPIATVTPGGSVRELAPDHESLGTMTGRAQSSALVLVSTWLVCLWPALSLVGLWDWWPSWAVYSSRPAIVQVSVDDADVEKLPDALRRHVGPPSPLSQWRPVNLDAWSFETCGCPMYPQERYRLAVAMAVTREYEATMEITVRSSPDRSNGLRQEQRLDWQTFEDHIRSFWFNTWRRGVWPPRSLD